MDPTLSPPLGLIAGSGVYPLTWARAARRATGGRLVAVAFTGETDPGLAELVDEVTWLRVGQLGRLLDFFGRRGVRAAVMAGQVAPRNLFDLRPDLKALLLLGRLRERHAASLFGAVADALAQAGVALLDATTFLEDLLAPAGHLAGPPLRRRQEADVAFGLRLAKEMARLDVGQSVVVKHGVALAVEAFEGTDQTIRRGGQLAGPRGGALLVKVAKARPDRRFDVPVIGPRTLETAAEARLAVVAVEAGQTLLLEKEALCRLAERLRLSLYGAGAVADPGVGPGTGEGGP